MRITEVPSEEKIETGKWKIEMGKSKKGKKEKR